MTRLAMRPAKSFWKKGQLWRITCQWLCQRMSEVAPGMRTMCRIAISASSTSGRTTRTRAIMPMSIGHCSRSAAMRSAASMSDTRRPMKRGITVSSAATARPAANIAAYHLSSGARSANRTRRDRRRTTHEAVSAFDFLKQNNSMRWRIHVGPEPEFDLLWPRLPETG